MKVRKNGDSQRDWNIKFYRTLTAENHAMALLVGNYPVEFWSMLARPE